MFANGLCEVNNCWSKTFDQFAMLVWIRWSCHAEP